MKKIIFIILILFSVHSIFAWTMYNSEKIVSPICIFTDSYNRILLTGATHHYGDTLSHHFNMLDSNCVFMLTPSWSVDTSLSWYDIHPNQIEEIGNRIYCSAIKSYFPEGYKTSAFILDSTFNVIATTTFEPPLSGLISYNTRIAKYSENESLLLITYGRSGQPNTYLHILRIDTTCTVIEDSLLYDLMGGLSNYNYSQTIKINTDGSVLFMAASFRDTIPSKVLVEFSFGDSVQITNHGILHNHESPVKLIAHDDGELSVLWQQVSSSSSYFPPTLNRFNSDLDLLDSTSIDILILNHVNNLLELSSGNLLVTGLDSYGGGLNSPFAFAEYSPECEFIRKTIIREELRDSVRFDKNMNLTTRCSNGDYLFTGRVKKPISETDSVRTLILIRVDSLFEDVSFPDQITESPKLPELLQLTFSPNPFNPVLRIETHEEANITIFDTQGRMLANLGKERTWEPDISSGVYLVRAVFGELERCEKVVLLK